MLLGVQRQLARCPVGHRKPQLLGGLTRQRHQLRELLGGELARAAAALLVVEQVEDHGFKRLVGDLRGGDRGKLVASCGDAAPPTRHALRVDVQQRRQGHGGLAVGGPEDDPDALGKPPLDRPRSCQPFQDRPLPRVQLNAGCMSAHGATLILQIDQRNFSELQPGCTRR